MTAGVAGVAGLIVGLYLLFADPGEPWLEVVALGADGAYGTVVDVPASWVDTASTTPEAVARVPMIIGVRNRGGAAARPGRLRLSVPMHFRLRSASGAPLRPTVPVTGPLIEYSLRPNGAAVEPETVSGAGRGVPMARDTLWLEVVMPSIYCVAMADSVPTFVAAPPMPVEPLGDVRIFYSFSGGDLDRRQTGLLRIRLDPSALRRSRPEEAVQTSPSEVHDPEAPFPALSGLHLVGSRRAVCGEPARPLEFLTFLWETPGGGRLFVIHFGGVPRKYLFDLDGDDVIEREMSDADADGRFETDSDLRMATPAFLLPTPPPEAVLAASSLDSLSPEQLAALDVFRDAAAGPYQPIGPPPDTIDRLDVFGPRRVTPAAPDRPSLADAPTRTAPPRRPGDPAPLGDPARPGDDRPADAPAARPDPDARTPEPSADDAGEQDATPSEEPEREPPDLLGVPVDSVGLSTPPDTTSGGG